MSAALQFEQVSKWYGVVLGISDITFALEQGVVGLLGVNGAGKTTLIKLASGLLTSSLGKVTAFGQVPASSLGVRARIGLCPDVDRFYEGMSGLAWVTYMARLLGIRDPKGRAERSLERLGMVDRMKKKIGGYSKGMRQRTKLARALVGDADLLLLDEPLNGLDPVGRHQMVELISELGAEGKAVLVSSHVLSEVEQMTKNLLLIHQGRLLAQGTIEDIRNKMEDRAHVVELRARDLRGLGSRLIALPAVEGVEVSDGRLVVRIVDAEPFAAELTAIGAEGDYGLQAMIPLDAGLEAVFEYLVR